MSNGKLIGLKIVGPHINPRNGVKFPGYTLVKIETPEGGVVETCECGITPREIINRLKEDGVETPLHFD